MSPQNRRTAARKRARSGDRPRPRRREAPFGPPRELPSRPDAPARKQRRAFSTIGGPTDVAGAHEASQRLAAMFDVDRGLDRALTHGFHSYAGRMHPSMARVAIGAWSQPADAILDPFCGSGTVLVEAMAAGRRATGCDASPLAVALATVRTSVLDAGKRRRLVEMAEAIGDASGQAARKRQRIPIPEWAAGDRQVFEPHVAFELYGLHARVMATEDDGIGLALRLSLSSILVKFMRDQPVEGGRPPDGSEGQDDGQGPRRRIARGLPSDFFVRRVEELARGLEALESAARATPRPGIQLGDAREMAPGPDQGRFALVLTSPPYAGTYDYAELHAVRFRWLGLDEGALRLRQVGARGVHAGEEWRQSRRAWLGEMARALRPGGHALLVVGDGVVDGRAEDAAAEVAREAGRVGLAFLARASQPRPVHGRRLRDIFGATTRREHVVLLRRA